MSRDEEDVRKLVSHFNRFQIFRQTKNLVVVTTGDIANEEVKEDLLKCRRNWKKHRERICGTQTYQERH